MKKVLTLYSSSRANGNTFQLVNTFNQLVPGEVCYLDDLNIAEYDYQHRNQDDDFLTVVDRMVNADVIILASPVYWYSMTPTLRRFFDRFTDLIELPLLKPKGKQLREKHFYLFATSVRPSPPNSFVAPVENTLDYLEWQFSGTVHINCKEGFEHTKAMRLLTPLAQFLKGESHPAYKSAMGEQARSLFRFK